MVALRVVDDLHADKPHKPWTEKTAFSPDDERGTSVALYDYARFNETLLQNKSWIVPRAW